MLAAIYQNDVKAWNLTAELKPRESDVEFEDDDTTVAKDEEAEENEITPDLEEDVFREEEDLKEIHALTEFF